MVRKKIKSRKIAEAIGIEQISIPKYSSGVINNANKYSHATRAENVSQVSETIKIFRDDATVPNHSLAEWERWYLAKYPDAITKATDDAWRQFKKMKAELAKVKKEHIKEWERDLIINKTYAGLMIQDAIIKTIAKDLGVESRLGTPEEEGRGIDGYINNIPVQIKSNTFQEEVRNEHFDEEIVMIYYTKDNRTADITFEYNRNDFE